MILTIWNRSSFRVGSYRWYWAGNVLVHITYLLQAVALGWHMLEVTGSPFQVGLVAFAYGLPLLFIAPFSGLVADRMKRQWVVQAAMAVAVLTSAVLALLVKSGTTEPIALLLASSMLGGTFAFYAPARLALLPNLVPDAMVFNATTLSYSGTRFMGFFGPVLAGYLLQFTDIFVTFCVQTALFTLGAALYLKATHFLPSPKRKMGAQGSYLQGFREISAYFRRNRALLALLFLSLVFVPIGMPYQKLMPIFVAQALNEGPALLGLLVGSASLGSALSGFAVVIVGDVYPKGKAILISSSLFGLGMVVFAFIRQPLFALGWIFLVGVASGLFLTLINALLLTQLPDELRGRTMSLWGMVWGLIPLTTLAAATVAEFRSISLVLVVAGACVTLTCITLWARRSPLLEL